MDSYINKNYSRLLQVSHNIVMSHTPLYKIKQTDNRDYTLLHEVFTQIYEKLLIKNSFLNSEDEFVRYVTTYLKNFHTFMKNRRYNNKKDNCLFTYYPTWDESGGNEVRENCYPDNSHEMIYIDSENIDDITKLFLKDLASNGITVEKGLLVNKIKDIGKSFHGVEREMFDLYFMQDLSCRRIYNELRRTNMKTMTYRDLLALQKNVKNKIINKLNA